LGKVVALVEVEGIAAVSVGGTAVAVSVGSTGVAGISVIVPGGEAGSVVEGGEVEVVCWQAVKDKTKSTSKIRCI